MHHYSDYQAELSACQKNSSGSGCGTILSMYGNESVPLSTPDSDNPTGVIANINTQTGQVVSYTLTNAQNQPVLIMQPSDYQNYLGTIGANGGSVYQFIGNNSPEYSLQAGNFLTDLGNGNLSQAGGNLAGWFTNGSYWRDMAISMASTAGVYASSVTSAVVTEADTAAINVGSVARQATSGVSPAIANATADAEAGGASQYSLTYQPTSGVSLQANAGQSTTILGSYATDMRYVVGELGNVKSIDFGANLNGFNVLNVPDGLYVSPKQFWSEYNEPWLSNVVGRGDPILMATPPSFGNGGSLIRIDPSTGQSVLTGFGKEYFYLRQAGYSYNPSTGQMTTQ